MRASGFLSTPSARRATPALARFACMPSYFYPRPPRGGRHFRLDGVHDNLIDFYPRPPRGGRLSDQSLPWDNQPISIHALREEGDTRSACPLTAKSLFLSTPSARRATEILSVRDALRIISIHALREEGDFRHQHSPAFLMIFLSTPSARRATVHNRFFLADGVYFYPRPPRGGRQPMDLFTAFSFIFLSTPSARRATRVHVLQLDIRKLFLSTPSARRATAWPLSAPGRLHYFYPRPPRGGRPVVGLFL